jgi:hypothetical protein
LREDLTQRWGELKTPLADRVECLSALLDAAPAAPELVTRYEGMVEKLSARQPIAQVHSATAVVLLFYCTSSCGTISLQFCRREQALLPSFESSCALLFCIPSIHHHGVCMQLASRKQFIEYKLKLSTRTGADGTSVTTGVSPADRAALIAELTEVSANLEAVMRQYERRFNEPYAKLSTDIAPGTPSQQGGGFVPQSPAASAATTAVSWGEREPSPRAQVNTTSSTSAASTPYANSAAPSARHSISLPTGGSGSAQQPSYMSPLASKTNAANAANATAGANGGTKSAFKSIPPVR